MNELENFKCLDCLEPVDKNDNYCNKCGHLTAKGYKLLNNNELPFNNINRYNKIKVLISLVSILIIVLFISILVRGTNLIRPLAYIEKQVNSYINGYNSSILKTNNTYSDIDINSYEDAIYFIKKDIENQNYLCSNNIEVNRLEYNLEEKYNIAKVSFCDMKYNISNEISKTIEDIYYLFPNIKGALTNITITNAPTNDEYIAYFQPMFQFVNSNSNNLNKINKTQILLNSYYYLNEDILKKKVENIVGTNWYVKDATWTSIIAHELGHYISFNMLLKENNIDNITFVTDQNENKINNILNTFDSYEFSNKIVNKALNQYNLKYNTNINLETFASSISLYASKKDENGTIITDETIAEAIHDYFLHRNNANRASLEIITIIMEEL